MYFKRVKTTTSPGPDGLHPKFLKEIIVSLADPQHLFNRLLHESYVPSPPLPQLASSQYLQYIRKSIEVYQKTTDQSV